MPAARVLPRHPKPKPGHADNRLLINLFRHHAGSDAAKHPKAVPPSIGRRIVVGDDWVSVRDKPAALFVNTPQKSRFFTVAAVNADIAELNDAPSGDFKHLQRQLRFTAKRPLVLRYRRFPAALVMAALSFGQIQPSIDQGSHVASTEGRKYAHLTVVHLNQATVPLPRNASGCVAFLGKTAFVKNQDRVLAAQQQIARFPRNLSTKALPINASFCQHVLHRLMVDGVDFTHPQHIGSFGLKQSTHIAFKRRGGVARRRYEK
jgi:hypothetical protein